LFPDLTGVQSSGKEIWIMTMLYRTILFLVLAGYGLYYNTAFNVVPPSSDAQVRSQAGHHQAGSHQEGSK